MITVRPDKVAVADVTARLNDCSTLLVVPCVILPVEGLVFEMATLGKAVATPVSVRPPIYDVPPLPMAPPFTLVVLVIVNLIETSARFWQEAGSVYAPKETQLVVKE